MATLPEAVASSDQSRSRSFCDDSAVPERGQQNASLEDQLFRVLARDQASQETLEDIKLDQLVGAAAIRRRADAAAAFLSGVHFGRRCVGLDTFTRRDPPCG